MGYTYAASDHIAYSENIEDLSRRDTILVTLLEMILDTIIAAQDQGRYQTQHLLCLYRQCAILVCLVVQAEKAIDHFVILG